MIAVVGATGQQGGACIDALLTQGDFSVRGVTRNALSRAAKLLSERGIELATGDLSDKASLVKVRW